MLVLLALLPIPLQDSRPAESRPVEVRLAPQAPRGRAGLRWSPKGAKVALSARDGALHGSFPLGPSGTLPVGVRLLRSDGAAHHDVLELGRLRAGALVDPVRLTTRPNEQRGKWWSSFEAELSIPLAATSAAAGSAPAARAYPLSLWFVADPQEPDAPPALRWSRRGWHQGEVELDGRPALVLLTEMEMDGVFDQRDAWALARDQQALLAAGSRSLEKHAWLDGVAYRAVRIDADGASLRFERFDPGISEAEERTRSDLYAEDRVAPRAAAPLAFGTNLAAALATAREKGQRVLVDFETTWCGPCQVMKQLVYTATPVVEAARGVVAVRLDGDEQRALVKEHKVGAYPTLILLDAEGRELRRAVGYRSVRQLVEFLRP